MSNIIHSRMQAVVTPEQSNAVKAALQTLNTQLPFLTGLTTEERSTLPSMNVNNKIFTEDALNAAHNNSSWIPTYLSVTNMQTDFDLYNQLDELILILRQALEKMEDTQRIAGFEAYTSALALYRMFGSAADAGVPGADVIYDQLKARFIANTGVAAVPTVS